MTDTQWFENYDGPKTLGWGEGTFHCLIGFNVRSGNCIVGDQVETEDMNPDVAVSKAKSAYENRKRELQENAI